MISLNKEFFKRTSTYINFALAVLPTIIIYVPFLNVFGIPENILSYVASFGAIAVMVAQVLNFKRSQIPTV